MTKQERKNAAKAIADSAQQIWLAGLGAFAKAQAEGSRLFDQLIDEGSELEKTTRKYTKDKVEELRGRMEGTAERLQRTGRSSMDRIQAMIDQRVAKAVERMAVPTREDIDALAGKMRDLNRRVVDAATAAGAGTTAAAQPKAAPAAKKARRTPGKKAAKATRTAKSTGKTTAAAKRPKKAASKASAGTTAAKPAGKKAVKKAARKSGKKAATKTVKTTAVAKRAAGKKTPAKSATTTRSSKAAAISKRTRSPAARSARPGGRSRGRSRR